MPVMMLRPDVTHRETMAVDRKLDRRRSGNVHVKPNQT